MKRIARWFTVVAVGVALLSAFVVSNMRMDDAYAAGNLSSGDVEAIKQRVLYKTVFANLQRCYNQMPQSISEDASNVWANFASTTYWSSQALQSDFLKFPFDVGKKNASSCPDMITGWSNNWFTDLFSGTGSYSGLLGLNTGAVVPNKNGTYNTTTVMETFLTNIGYTRSTDTTSTDNLKCFYFNLTVSDKMYEDYGLLRPSKGSTFETGDYCVSVNAQGNVYGTPTYLTNRLAGGGHRTEDANSINFYFATDSGLAPQFRHFTGGEFKDKDVMQAMIESVHFKYHTGTGYSGLCTLDVDGARSCYLPVRTFNNSTTTECGDLGYYHCYWYTTGGFLSSTTYFGGLSTAGSALSYNDFKSRMRTLLQHVQDTYNVPVFSSVSSPIESTTGDASYTKAATNTKFIQYFLGNTSNYNHGNLLPYEQYILYYTYLKDNYDVVTSSVSMNNAVKVAWLNSDGSFSDLYIYDPDNSSDEYYIPSTGGSWLNATSAGWHEIAERMKVIDVSTAFDGATVTTDPILDPAVTPPSGSSTSGGDVGALDGCFTNAGVLGWIMCPVIRLLEGAVDGIYDVVIQDSFLQIGANTITDPATRTAWGKFQGFSNIVFAIILVLVILSQVTGVGLSNYNIKKMLPRLIITIVLVNLSFVLCSIAIDLSNILGVRLNEMFENFYIPNRSFGDINPGTYIKNTVTSLFAGGALVFGAVTIISEMTMKGLWKLLMLPIILGIVGVVIGILFFFIVLGVRQAAIIILLVVSPLAIICYVLPNTQKIFDRWLKAFSSLLIVFPICGLMMGGGNFISRLLLNTAADKEGFMFFFVAMLMPVVPFFFIPSVVKNSLSALGSLGVKISQMGSRVGNGITRGLRGSEWARDLQRQNMMDYNLAATNQLFKKREAIQAKNPEKDLSGRQKRSLQRHASAYKRARFEDIRAGADRYDDLPIPGSDAERFAMQEVSDKQHAADVANMASIYAAGGDKIGFGGSDMKADDIDSQGNELEHQYKELARRIDTGEDTKETETRIEALHDLLSKTDPGRARVQDAMSGLAANDSLSRETREGALGKVAGHLRRKHGDLYKAKNRGFHSMIEDFAGGRFSHAFETSADGQVRSTFRPREVSVPDGGTRTSYRSDFYDKNKVSSYDEQGLAGADDTALTRLRDGVADGMITGQSLQSLSRIANRALSMPSLNMKDENRTLLNEIAAMSYAAQSQADGATNTDGTQAILGASKESLEHIVEGMSGGAFTPEQKVNIAKSARAALLDPNHLHTQESAERLNQILAAAGQAKVDPAAIKLRGADFGAQSNSGQGGIDVVHGNPDIDELRRRAGQNGQGGHR